MNREEMQRNIFYSDKYYDDKYEYRQVYNEISQAFLGTQGEFQKESQRKLHGTQNRLWDV